MHFGSALRHPLKSCVPELGRRLVPARVDVPSERWVSGHSDAEVSITVENRTLLTAENRTLGT